MLVFISHSFEDSALLENLCYFLDDKKVDYWGVEQIHSGKNLADQLREAILKCDACVFLATNNSVNSSWCAAELGAFWGSGKTVLIYQPETNLDVEKLPKQFNGHFIEKKLKRLIEALRNIPEKQVSKEVKQTTIDLDSIRDLIETAFNRILNVDQLKDVYEKIASKLPSLSKMNETQEAELKGLVSRLLMREKVEIELSISDYFRFKFSLMTSNGEWIGYAQEQSSHADGDVFVDSHCVLIQFNERSQSKAVAVVEKVIEGYNRGVAGTKVSGKLVLSGRHSFGEVFEEQNFQY